MLHKEVNLGLGSATSWRLFHYEVEKVQHILQALEILDVKCHISDIRKMLGLLGERLQDMLNYLKQNA